MALFYPHHKCDWLDFGLLRPAWLWLALSLFFYFYTLWLGIWFYRAARGKERILILALFLSILISKAQKYLPHSSTAIKYAEAPANVVTFIVAVYISRQFHTSNSPLVSN